MKRIASTLAVVLVTVALIGSAATRVVAAASPNPIVHYQGVLRDASDNPRNGSFDMIFRFFDASAGGQEILVDSHLAAGTGAVSVAGGLFGADLGGGTVTDGSGAAEYSSLSQVFRDFSSVFLEITIGGETLSPRVAVVSSAYALNSDSLDGKSSSEFINKQGFSTQAIDGDLVATSYSFSGLSAAGTCCVAHGSPGCDHPDVQACVCAADPFCCGNQWDTTCVTEVVSFGCGSCTTGPADGAKIFAHADGLTVTAGNADTDRLILTAGNSVNDGQLQIRGGSVFQMTSGNGTFQFIDGITGSADAVIQPSGLTVNNPSGGLVGRFNATLGLQIFDGVVETAKLSPLGDLQIDGDLTLSGGDIIGNVGISGDLSVVGNDITFSAAGPAVHVNGNGLQLNGGDTDTDDLALVAGNSLDDGQLLINGDGAFELRAGDGLFTFVNGATALETASLDATGDLQIDGDLTVSGGDIGVPSGFNLNILAQVTLTTKANGNSFSGIDEDNNDTNRLATWYHNGSAVQANKLMDLDENGVLRIRATLSQNSMFDLAETFFMTDPVEPGDLVSVDPLRPFAIRRTVIESDPAVVGVVSTRPGVVLGGAPFDTAALGEAWGREVLEQFESERSGIETELLEGEPSLVQGDDRAAQLEDLALRRFHAQHFAPIALAGRVPVKVDASFGTIEVGDALAPSAIPGVAMKATKPGPVVGTALEAWHEGRGKILALVDRGWFGPATSREPSPEVRIDARPGALTSSETDRAVTIEGRDPAAGDAIGALATSVETVPFAFPVSVHDPVESGDVLAADIAHPGQLELARRMADPTVVGIAAGGSRAIWRGRAPLALPGTIVRCKVDASNRAILPGDLLVASAMPGHAMAMLDEKPGTVIAKALEPLASGTGMILVLVEPR